jgi:hypothetical protein
MTSQVNPNNIDGTYPVAGQDNDSQGFRDNFTNIRNNFTYIKAEVEDLQNKALLKTNLTNSTLSNDLAGNAVVNASLTSWRETYKNNGTMDGTNTINFSNGNFQRIVLNSAVTLNFTWPSNTAGQVASIKLWVNIPTVDPTRTLTFGTAPTLGDPDTIAGYSAGTITFNSAELTNNSDYLFEIWTPDAGVTLGIKDLVRNRDIDLSGLQISGNLNVDGITATANTSVAGNLINSGGRINSNYAYVTLVNDQNFFANISYNTLFVDTASSATISNARIALPSGAENGREITLSFLAPITSVWVNRGNTALVKWFPNTTVSSGNVVAKFTYSVANSNWLRSG